MKYSITDNSLHLGGGALLALPLVLLPSPISTGLVFFAWGLLREQAQKNNRMMTFHYNWVGIWNSNKIIEALSWGLGGFLTHSISVWFR